MAKDPTKSNITITADTTLMGVDGPLYGKIAVPDLIAYADLTSDTSGAVAEHLADTIDAHDASAISFAAAGTIAATDVQAAIAEVASDAAADLAAHLTDTVDAHDASAISVATTATLLSTTVQGALQEVEGDAAAASVQALAAQSAIDTHIADPIDAHDASAISFAAASGFVATTAQAAIEEARSDAIAYTDTHIADATAAHAASAVSFAATADIVATDVQAAIVEVRADAATMDAASLATHTGDATAAHAASAISCSFPVGGYLYPGGLSTEVANAVVQIDAGLFYIDEAIDNHIADSVAAHAASAISFTPAGSIASTTVQAALAELDTEKAATSHTQAFSTITGTPTTLAGYGITDGATDSELSAHTGDTSGAHASTAISHTWSVGTPWGLSGVATTVLGALDSLAGELYSHEVDSSAHDASVISFAAASGFVATTAQAAIEEAKSDAIAYTDAHIADATSAHASSAISFTFPVGSYTNPGGKITEADTALNDIDAAMYDINANKVPNSRTITATAPLTIGGGASADLSANRTIAISEATTSASGSMSSTDKTKLEAITTGTWTPTLSSVSGYTGTPTIDRATYTKVSSTRVHINVRATGTFSGAGPARSFNVTLPVARSGNFAAAADANGIATGHIGSAVGYIQANVGAQTMALLVYTATTGSCVTFYEGEYDL